MPITLYPHLNLVTPTTLNTHVAGGVPYQRVLASRSAFTVPDAAEAELLVNTFGLYANGASGPAVFYQYPSPLRMNWTINPSIETDSSGWDSSGVRDTSWGMAGAANLRVQASRTNNDLSCFNTAAGYVPVAAGDVITTSVYYKIGPNATNTGASNGPRLLISYDDGSGAFALRTDATPTVPAPAVAATGRLSLTGAAAPAGTTRIRARLLAGVSTGTQFIDTQFDAILTEKVGTLGAYFDGSGYIDPEGLWVSPSTAVAWTGASGGSPSVIGLKY
jgi:hypothetical protein